MDNLMHLQQHNYCQFVAEKTYNNKHMCTREFRVKRRLIHSEEGHLLEHCEIQLYHQYCDFRLIFNGEFIYKHCLTDIPKLETFDGCAHGMSPDN